MTRATCAFFAAAAVLATVASTNGLAQRSTQSPAPKPASAARTPQRPPAPAVKPVAAHKAMMMAVRDKVAVLVGQNKTQEEVIAAKPTAEFDSKVTGATPQTADRFVGQLYQELKK